LQSGKLPTGIDFQTWEEFVKWKVSISALSQIRPCSFLVNYVTLQQVHVKKCNNEILFAVIKVNYAAWGQNNPEGAISYPNKEGLVFLCGRSCAVLVILIDEGGNEYVLLTQEAGSPANFDFFPEIPDGMQGTYLVDLTSCMKIVGLCAAKAEGGNSSKGKGAEGGNGGQNHVVENDLKMKSNGVYKYLRCYIFRVRMPLADIQKLDGHRGVTTLSAMAKGEVWQKIPYEKILASLYLYDMAMQDDELKAKIEKHTVDAKENPPENDEYLRGQNIQQYLREEVD